VRIVIVSDHSARWAQLFAEEAAKLRVVFGDLLLEIHHIGSTSVPGLPAKPVIDIMPVVKDIAQVDLLNVQMESLGYEAMGECGLAGRRYFRKGGDDRTHNVHTYQWDNRQAIERHLAVRDYLRTHPATAKEYGELKQRLARQFPTDIYGYMDGKDSFVKALEQEALRWRQKQK